MPNNKIHKLQLKGFLQISGNVSLIYMHAVIKNEQCRDQDYYWGWYCKY